MAGDINNILVVGDSLARGVVLDEARNRYVLYDDCFVNAVRRQVDARVDSAAKFGSTVSYGLDMLQKRLSRESYDLVLLEFGGNDCDFCWDEIAKAPEAPHLPKTPMADFKAGYTRLIELVKKAGAVPVTMTLPPLNAKAYFDRFTGGCAQKGRSILKWLDDVWRIYWWQERYSAAVKSISERMNTTCIDIRTAFLARFDFTDDFRSYMCSDGIHPNEKGHGVITACILDTIRSRAGYLLAPASK